MGGTIKLDWKVVLWDPTKEIMAANAASCVGLVEVRGVIMDVKDHVGGSKSNGGIGVSSTVVQHPAD